MNDGRVVAATKSATNCFKRELGQLLAEKHRYLSGVYDGTLSTFPVRKIAGTMRSVMYPAMSKVQDDNDRIKRAYLKNLSYISLVTFPLLAGLSVVAEAFVSVVYGEKWMEAAIPLQFLCWAGLFRTITVNFGSIYRIKGKPQIDFQLQLGRLVLLIFFVLGLYRFGLGGVAFGLVLTSLIVLFTGQSIVNRLIGLTYHDLWRDLRPALIGSLCIILSVEGYQIVATRYFQMGPLLSLASSVIIGMIAYGFALRWTQPTLVSEVLQLVFSTIRSMKLQSFRPGHETPKGIR